ncbi:AAA family ATPase [Dorea sp. AF36-15AT]|uniref:AAA family ATPase n=1 Tax=Dorea sp. AF36-15AT TaxID=2292041 RepID=UPI001FA9C49D|nr:AAA family ATPase [Dorea sp. AF36-15AT]
MQYNIPIGISEFEKIRKNDYYYVDKTDLIQTLLKTEPAEITLFTRPRRFGKTLVMSMLASFFDIRRENRDLFKGLKVAKDQKLCQGWMNQWPVIFLSFKDVGGECFEDAYGLLQSVISQLYVEHTYLEESMEIDESYKDIFGRLKRRQGNKTDVQISLRVLMRMMQIYYGKQVILLIDEYDVPMAKAGNKAYYNEMLDVIGTMMSQALKDNTALKFSVITGCLRISKESIFTGTNNFVADTIADERFSNYFGFTNEEVQRLLEDTGNIKYQGQIKKWYDGYCFGKTEIYCPWDVLCYLNKLAFESESEPENFWENTSHNDIIRTFLSCEGMDVTDSFERLLAGETIEVEITDNLTYENLTDSEENLWSVLYLTGYLTKDIRQPLQGKTKAFLKIPNAEIMDIFRKSVVRWFDEQIAVRDRSSLFIALWNEDVSSLSELISDLLFETISYHDYAESFYHAFLAGLFTNAGYIVESNYESGLGRPDLVIKNKKKRQAVIIEIKIADSMQSLQKSAEKAMDQIDDMRYADGISAQGYQKVIKYGASFYQKNCLISKSEV